MAVSKSTMRDYHAHQARHHNDTVSLLKRSVLKHTDPLIDKLIIHHGKFAKKHQKVAEFLHKKIPSTQEL